jgi:putative Mg2+ transporter-C (MgtC) family protein
MDMHSFNPTADDLETPLRLLAGLCAGALIGYERRITAAPPVLHASLVCMASSLLMLVTVYEAHWRVASDSVRLDPTRMAQGIMTGIGFLGAGAIIKMG